MDTREFRDAGHRMIDWIAEYLDAIEGRALFPKGADPRAIEALFDEALPQEGTPLEALMGDLDRKLVPNCCHVNHPGYFRRRHDRRAEATMADDNRPNRLTARLAVLVDDDLGTEAPEDVDDARPSRIQTYMSDKDL